MSEPTPDLTELAARLLVGTGIDPAHAALVASGQSPADSPTARALRDGWTAPDTIPPVLRGLDSKAAS